jgi:imidazolonepropionase-like amidohydrolase
MRSLGFRLLFAAALCAPGLARQPQAEETAVSARSVLLPDGSVQSGARVRFQDGKIRSIEGMSDKHDAFDGEWLTPGLIAGRSYSGAAGETVDDTRTVISEARMLAAFEPKASDFARAAAAGVTTLVLAPSPENLVGGVSAVVKTRGTVALSAEGHLALSFTASAQNPLRMPTSASGGLAELRRLFKSRESGPVALAAAARLPVLLAAEKPDEIQRALAFAREWNVSGALVGASLAGEVAELVHEAGVGVIVGPLVTGTPQRELDATVALARRGVPLAFAVDAPLLDPVALRLAAALCVRAGMDPKDALRALTSGAAALAGVSERVGRLEVGRDADLVLWSGSPLELSSRVRAVWIDGLRIDLERKEVR